MKKPMTICTTGLGHPEGPYELDDGRVVRDQAQGIYGFQH